MCVVDKEISFTCLSPYLEGQGDLLSGLIRGINGVTIWVISVINLLTKWTPPRYTLDP